MRARFIILLPLFTFVLAACSSVGAQYSGAESPKDIKVTWVNFRYDVLFADGEDAITAQERTRLDAFLRQIQMTPSSRFAVAAAAGPLAAARSDAVAAVLRGYRGGNTPISPGSVGDIGSGSVAVIVGRYIATPPRCPDWRKPSNQNPQNSPASNFGCASAVNLALMVEDPGDLLRGRQLGPGDAAGLVHGIQRYRSNLVIPPAEVQTQESVVGSQ